MSHHSLKKKLQPMKKALKRIKYYLQSSFNNPNFSRAIRVIKTSTNSLISYCSHHLFLPFRKRFITKRPTYSYSHLYQSYNYKSDLAFDKNFSAIHIDHLYATEPAAESGNEIKHFHAHAETSKGKVVVCNEEVLPRKDGKGKEKVLYSVEDAWREVLAKSPQLRPVDERAEEFISKFRQEMKLRKERSLLEFQERLTRGA